jgi:hypothetical protein
VVPSGPSLAEAGKTYTRLTNPLNAAVFALSDEQERSSPSLAKLRRLSRDLGDQCSVFLRALAAVEWPAAVRADVEAVQSDVAAMLDAARQAQEADSVLAYREAWAGYVPSHAAQKLRAKLGFGEVPTSG